MSQLAKMIVVGSSVTVAAAGATTGRAAGDPHGHGPSAAKCNAAILREWRRRHHRGFTVNELNALYRRLHKQGICPNVRIALPSSSQGRAR
ncbi:MAG: hypothetical protein E6G56_15515 [Actinobacteria bacterium]|nr:MAG: hypothetical protein E6G56_15515 [Actinomycetota bacterium]